MQSTEFLDQFDAIFFDLDGTLLSIPDEKFEEIYMKLITQRFSQFLEPETFLKYLWKGTEDMMKHDDENLMVLEAFFQTFSKLSGMTRDQIFEQFDQFYRKEFNKMGEVVEPLDVVKPMLEHLREKNKKVVLATNPVFPEVATRNRCNWIGLDFDEFDYVSHAENSFSCKPSPSYFLNICELVDVNPNRVLMVGNDYLFDMSAAAVGMETWLLDKHHGNLQYKGKFPVHYQGSLTELFERIKN